MWDFVTRDIQCIAPDADLVVAMERMSSSSSSHLPVVDAAGQLVGLLGHRDVERALTRPREGDLITYLQQTTVSEVMEKNPTTIEHDGTTREAMRLFVSHRLTALPVMKDGALAGLLCRSDLLRAFESESATPDPTLDITETPPTYDLPFRLEHDRALVFLVEPSPNLRRDLAVILEVAGMNVTGFATLSELVSHQGLEVPDAILTSAQIGNIEASLEALRVAHPRTPLVVTTSVPGGSIPGKGPLRIPCSPQDLVARIRGEIGYNRWTRDLPLRPATAPLVHRTVTLDIHVDTPKQVLVVEGDVLSRKVLTNALERAGCQVSTAVDEPRALERLLEEAFDLVVFPLHRPTETGMGILRFAQQNPRRIGRMVVTTEGASEADVMEAFSLGALDLLPKPLALESLPARIERLLSE